MSYLTAGQQKTYLLVGQHPWSRNTFYTAQKRLYDAHWTYFEDDAHLLPKVVENLKPDKIFFVHWSFKVPAEITDNYECICFHPSHLPYGRGGTPIQNLIKEGFEKTRLSAFRMTQEIDAGPLYLQVEFPLHHRTAQEIYMMVSNLAVNMIEAIIIYNIQPRPQEGEPYYFKRRTPAMSEMSPELSLEDLYDHIRMLSADGYPLAFITWGDYRLEFEDPAFYNGGYLGAKVRILKND